MLDTIISVLLSEDVPLILNVIYSGISLAIISLIIHLIKHHKKEVEKTKKEYATKATYPKGINVEPIRGSYTSLLTELQDKCHPKKFMEPYDAASINIATELYSEIKNAKPDDTQELRRLRAKAIQDLGIKFSTENIFNNLMRVCNPKRYGDDMEKVKVANELYSDAIANAQSIEALEDIEEKYNNSILVQKSTPIKDTDNLSDETEDTGFWAPFFIIISIGITIFIICFICES